MNRAGHRRIQHHFTIGRPDQQFGIGRCRRNLSSIRPRGHRQNGTDRAGQIDDRFAGRAPQPHQFVFTTRHNLKCGGRLLQSQITDRSRVSDHNSFGSQGPETSGLVFAA